MIKLLSTISLALFMAPMAQPSLLFVDEASFRCMMETLYHEARGEGVQGMEAVASVVMNRAKRSKKSVCSVVYERKQFSWLHVTKDKHIRGNIMNILSITHKALSGALVDVTHGAIIIKQDIPNGRLVIKHLRCSVDGRQCVSQVTTHIKKPTVFSGESMNFLNTTFLTCFSI